MGQGHSIVYCDKCGQLLREDDFLKGKASTVDNRSFCALCRPVEAPPPEPVPTSSSSSGRLKSIPGTARTSTTRLKPPSDSNRLPAMALPLPPPPAKSSAPMVIGGVVAVVAVIGIVAALSSSGGRPREPVAEPEAPRATIPKAYTPKPVAPSSGGSSIREEAGRAAYTKALEVKRTRPLDLAAQARAFQEVVATMGDTPFAEEATRELVSVKRQLFDKHAAFENDVQGPLRLENFKEALAVWEAARAKYDLPEWTQMVDQRLNDLKAMAKGRFIQARDAAIHAKRLGAKDPIKKQRDRVEKWGLPEYVAEFDKALAEATAEGENPPVPPPPPGAVSKAVDTYRARWKAALAPVEGRDVTDVVKAVADAAAGLDDPEVKKDAAADLENIKLVAALVKDALPLLPRLPKGQKAAVSYWDPAGKPARVEDEVLKIDSHRVEIKQGDSSIVIPLGELAPVTVAELFRARAAKRPDDGRAAAFFCVLEGDAEGARKFQGEPPFDIPDRYLAYARELKASDKEKAARAIFYEAEATYYDYGRTLEAIRRYKLLLADHAGTAFVRRNRGAIAARTEGAKEYLYLPGDLVVSAGFKSARYNKIDGVRVSSQDVDASAMSDQYVDIDFSALPQTEYRCWVFAGGCCQEVLSFSYQASELTGPDPQNPREKIPLEPGAATGLPAKVPSGSMKKLHSQHTGPKEPDRFDWIPVTLPKFTSPGPKKLRLITSQKGFGVAYVCVSSVRPGTPQSAEFREHEKFRAETPGFAPALGGVATGSILREVWKGINGNGLGELTGNAAFKEGKSTESGLIAQFEVPVDFADNYGTRLRGYVHPPVTGNYIFWITSDDQSQLFLSTDDDPARKVTIAGVQDHCSPKVFDKYPAQKSQPIALVAGRRYYIEALHKDGGGGDHLTVGWQLPTGAKEIPIPGKRLSPFSPTRK